MSDYIYGSSLRAAKSKANYLFDGDFRRKPSQNLSGASRSVARVELLQQAAHERQTRSDARRREDAALKIQASYRGHKSRSGLTGLLRQEFDTYIAQIQHHDTPSQLQQCVLLSRELIVFYRRNRDDHRLCLLIKLMMQCQDAVLDSKKRDPQIWVYRICRLLAMCIETMKSPSPTDPDQLSSYIQFFLIFTRPEDVLIDREASYVWGKLIGFSFFPAMRALYDKNLNVELSLELIRRSLNTDPTHIRPCDTKPAYRFFHQYLKEPLEPALEELIFIRLFESRPRLLEPNLILQAFREMHDTKFHLPFHSATHFNKDQYHGQSIDAIKETIQMCYFFIKSLSNRVEVFDDAEKVDYVNFIWTLLEPAEYITSISLLTAESRYIFERKDEDELTNPLNTSSKSQMLTRYYTDIHNVITKILELINQLPHIDSLRSIIFSGTLRNRTQLAIVKICNLMLSHQSMAIFNCRLLYTVAFSKEFSRSLWRSIVSATSPSKYIPSTPIHALIARGSQEISQESWTTILPQLKLFCSLCSYLLPTLGDEEFYTREENQIYSFTQDEHPKPGSSSDTNDNQISGSELNSFIRNFYVDKELLGISAILRDMAIGLVEIIYHRNQKMIDESSNQTKLDNMRKILGGRSILSQTVDESTKLLSYEIKSSFQVLVRILCQLHARDSRKQFCPEGHWICRTINLPSKKSLDYSLSVIQQGRLLDRIGFYTSKTRQLTVSSEIKTVLILQEIPFVVSFHDRVKIFHNLLEKERGTWSRRTNPQQSEASGTISLKVRRNYIYEDAFENLCLNNEQDLKKNLRISLINPLGLPEAGIDGGGLTKEFISELLKTGFDPMRGFFKYTNDNFLYPNPTANVLFANLNEGHLVHYEFLGRMLGKAMYQRNLVELPFASFFLAKLLAVKDSSDIDLHNLESLDPVLYKNLVYLKNYKGDVADLDLDFTISNNDLDEHEVVELKPGGSKIAVTRENKIEYVHLVADYRLNKQIRQQCSAFKRGLAKLIDLDWLRMFDARELQILISGAPSTIDVDDWRKNTHYCNGYVDNSPAIEAFWAAVRRFSENSKRKLLKFATSCSFPPLLGFKELHPSFAIAPSDEQRLPTASTCMNLLKLPKIEDEETMHSKLLYAIESNSGFEYS